jgi:acetyl esterase/lipase
MARLLARFGARSAAARAELGEPLRLAYGDAAIEGVDWHRSRAARGRPAAGVAGPGASAPVVFFVHGGAWRSGARPTTRCWPRG